jgi:hypothetical protein
MEYLYSLGVIGSILYVAYILMARAKADKVIAELRRKDRSEEHEAIIRAQKDLENAEIVYRNARAEYDSITGDGADSKLLDE